MSCWRWAPLTVSLHNEDDVEIVARHGDGAPFGIDRMSDGERNAAIIAATVLTVKAGTILLVDEPERHLHRSIIVPFLSALFERRRDCPFVVSTHEVALTLSNPGARVLVTRSCTWNGDAPRAWDAELLDNNVDLPEDLKLAVLGGRRRILFVEGTPSSLDLPVYSAIFPGLDIAPMRNCVEVQRAVAGLRATAGYHHVEALGLIDRDARSDADVDALAAQAVYALDVCSVESLYYCSDAIGAVARRQAESLGLDPEPMIQSATRAALGVLEQADTAARMAARRCEARVRDSIVRQMPTWKEIQAGDAEKIDLQADSLYAKELKRFQHFLDAGNLDALVARYPLRESSTLGEIARKLKCSSIRDYEQMVVVQAMADTDLAHALRGRVRPLADAIAG